MFSEQCLLIALVGPDSLIEETELLLLRHAVREIKWCALFLSCLGGGFDPKNILNTSYVSGSSMLDAGARRVNKENIIITAFMGLAGVPVISYTHLR